MSKRTLSDELRSVLLAHSLDAPVPDATVDDILARTVGVRSDESGGYGSRSTVAPAGGRWRDRRPSVQVLAAAAVIAFLVLAAAGVNSLRGRGSGAASSTAQSAVPAAGADGRSLLVPKSAAGAPNAPLNTGRLNTPNQSFSSLAARLPTPPLPTDLPCSSIPGGHATIGSSTVFSLTSTGESRFVYEFRCVGTDGARSASEIQVFQLTGGAMQLVSTIVPVSKGGHLDFFQSRPNGVRVQGTDQSPGQRPGDLISVDYVTSDGGRTFSSTGRLIARGCQAADLTSRVLTQPGGATGEHQVLQITNRTSSPCAIEGFPQLLAVANGGPARDILTPTLTGPSGGARGSVPPIVNLIPGGTAGAIVELGSAHPTCAPTSRPELVLPDRVSLGRLPIDLSACGLQVHPFVDNANGTY